MSTGSSRSRRRRDRRQRQGGQRPEPAAQPAPADDAPHTPARWAGGADLSRYFWPAAGVTLLVAALLRLYALSLKPFHHDEGINGWFVTNLVRHGEWAYDPANYHGPTLFFLGLASEIVFGLTDEAMRLVPALFGLGTVALVLAMRPLIGPVAALVGAALLGVSPGASYVSRYFIHESMVAFFTLAAVVALLYLVNRRQQRYLVLAAVSIALLLATKETGIVSLAVMAIAVAVGTAYLRLRRGAPPPAASGRGDRRGRRPPSHRPRRPLVTPIGVGAAAIAFGVTYVLLFSSFLANPQGLVDSLATFTIWTQTGTETQVQPLQQYLVWMLQADAAIVALGLMGGLVVAWRADSPTAVFIGLWGLGITMAYSLVSYKTPWIALNMLVPLAVLAGLGVDRLLRILPPRAAPATAAALAVALGLSSYQAWEINFVRYDDDRQPYVFVHTTRDALELVAATERLAAATGEGTAAGIVIVSPEYWPLPWYFRNYPRAGFYGQLVPTEEPIIIAHVDQAADVEAQFGERYVQRATYNLRPGVDLTLWARNDL